MIDNVWTPPETDLLRQLLADGLSAGRIAAKLPGKTRNAVIGKVSRLGLALGNAKPGQATRLVARQAHAAWQPKVIQKSAKSRAKASEDNGTDQARLVGRGAAGDVSRRGATRSAPATSERMDATAGETAPSIPSVLPAIIPIRFFDAVEAGRCLHFIGDWLTRDGPDLPVCGGERVQGDPKTRYCPRHAPAPFACEAA